MWNRFVTCLAVQNINEPDAAGVFFAWISIFLFGGSFLLLRFLYRRRHLFAFLYKRRDKRTAPMAKPILDRDEPRGWINLKERSRHVRDQHYKP